MVLHSLFLKSIKIKRLFILVLDKLKTKFLENLSQKVIEHRRVVFKARLELLPFQNAFYYQKYIKGSC